MNGHSLLSVVVALALSIPVMWIGLDMLSSSVLLNSKAKVTSAEDNSLLALRAELRDLMEAYDSSSLASTMRIHPPGGISYADGTPNPIGLTSPKLLPEPGSNAITVAELLPLAILEVGTADTTTPTFLFNACLRYKSSESYLALKGYLRNSSRFYFAALHADGFEELIGSATITHDTAPHLCLDLNLSATKSMISSSLLSSSTTAPSVFKLIPIVRIYSLYIDRQEQLRYVGHYGNSNIENQPLLRHLNSLNITEYDLAGSGAKSIHAKVNLSSGRAEEFSITGHLAHAAHYNLLLN